MLGVPGGNSRGGVLLCARRSDERLARWRVPVLVQLGTARG
jgi:hypothetical protein